MESAFRAWHKTRNTHHKGRVKKEIEMGFEYVDFSTAILLHCIQLYFNISNTGIKYR